MQNGRPTGIDADEYAEVLSKMNLVKQKSYSRMIYYAGLTSLNKANIVESFKQLVMQMRSMDGECADFKRLDDQYQQFCKDAMER